MADDDGGRSQWTKVAEWYLHHIGQGIGRINRLMFVRSPSVRTQELSPVENRTVEQLLCYHCGDPIQAEHVLFDDKDFCCQGCQAVYGLLSESGLCDYYQLADTPGIREDKDPNTIRMELIDLPEVRSKLVEYSVDGISRVRFHVPQMHCSSCIWLLENLQRLEPAIIRSRVRFTNKELTVTFREDRVSLRSIVELIGRIGYPPVLSDPQQVEGRMGVGIPRIEYVKLGVAGFAFGNIMLFSFPEYLGANASDPGMMKGFQLLNFVFSLPVVLFSGAGFFRSAWAGLKTRVVNIDVPIALGIVALFSRSVWDVLSGQGPGYFDSLAGLVFFLLIGRWYQAYTYQAMSFDRSLNDFLPLVVIRIRNGKEEAVNVSELRKGDRIIVRDQELIPVDGVLRAGTGSIDNSFMTGESLPSERTVGDMIHAGGRQRGALIEVEVMKPFHQSRLKRLWEEHGSDLGREHTAMPQLIDVVARRFTIAVILIAAAAGIFWAGHSPSMVWPVVTAVLIVACPCALALSMPFAYGHTMRILGGKGLFLRDSGVVERMARVDTVVFDKTGTLTAREAFDLRFVGDPLGQEEESRVRSLARNSTHPLSRVLYDGLKAEWHDAIEVDEIPGLGISGSVQGLSVRIGSVLFTGGEHVPVRNGELRAHIAMGGCYRGYFAMRKRPREGMARTVEGVRALARTWLLTGDDTVDTEVRAVFKEEEVRTNSSPQDKAGFVLRIQREGSKVLMVGDGLNDAGALRQSDVGISVSETSAAMTPASDAILDARRLDVLPAAILLTRKARKVVMASLVISLCYNLAGVSFAVAGELTPLVAAILMPLSSVTVVAFVTLSIGMSARRILAQRVT